MKKNTTSRTKQLWYSGLILGSLVIGTMSTASILNDKIVNKYNQPVYTGYIDEAYSEFNEKDLKEFPDIAKAKQNMVKENKKYVRDIDLLNSNIELVLPTGLEIKGENLLGSRNDLLTSARNSSSGFSQFNHYMYNYVSQLLSYVIPESLVESGVVKEDEDELRKFLRYNYNFWGYDSNIKDEIIPQNLKQIYDEYIVGKELYGDDSTISDKDVEEYKEENGTIRETYLMYTLVGENIDKIDGDLREYKENLAKDLNRLFKENPTTNRYELYQLLESKGYNTDLVTIDEDKPLDKYVGMNKDSNYKHILFDKSIYNNMKDVYTDDEDNVYRMRLVFKIGELELTDDDIRMIINSEKIRNVDTNDTNKYVLDMLEHFKDDIHYNSELVKVLKKENKLYEEFVEEHRKKMEEMISKEQKKAEREQKKKDEKDDSKK